MIPLLANADKIKLCPVAVEDDLNYIHSFCASGLLRMSVFLHTIRGQYLSTLLHDLNDPAFATISPRPNPTPTPQIPPSSHVDHCPSMDVKSLIDYFNHRSNAAAQTARPIIPQPVYDLNGKVKHLVREFSKSSPSLAVLSRSVEKIYRDPRSFEPVALQNNGGCCAVQPGVSPGPRRVGQVSGQGGDPGLVEPVQSQPAQEREDSKKRGQQKQMEEPQQAVVDLARNVDGEAITTRMPRTSRDSRGGKQVCPRKLQPQGAAPSCCATTTFEVLREPDAKPRDITDVAGRSHVLPSAMSYLGQFSRMGSRGPASPVSRYNLGSLESVVMSARNSVLRKLRLTGGGSPAPSGAVAMSEVGDSAAVDAQGVPRNLTSSTAPPPLRIVKKARIAEGEHGQGIIPPSTFMKPLMVLTVP